MALDTEIFEGKTLKDLFSEIHSNSSNTRSQVRALINELKPLIENIGDATLIVPMIKEYMEIGVKNDDALIKLATIVQRIEAAQAKGEAGADFFDFSDIESLLDDTKDVQKKVEDTKEEGEENADN